LEGGGLAGRRARVDLEQLARAIEDPSDACSIDAHRERRRRTATKRASAGALGRTAQATDVDEGGWIGLGMKAGKGVVLVDDVDQARAHAHAVAGSGIDAAATAAAVVRAAATRASAAARAGTAAPRAAPSTRSAGNKISDHHEA